MGRAPVPGAPGGARGRTSGRDRDERHGRAVPADSGREARTVRRTIIYGDALREAIREEMLRDERVFILGEDIAGYGGTYSVTKGLVEEFGEQRVRDTPLAEEVIAGTAIGAAIGGAPPHPPHLTAHLTLVPHHPITQQPPHAPPMFH